MSIRDEQKEQRRQAILEAGLDLFIRRGYSATKISDIAKEVKMSVGLLFHYFSSKEKLYEELVRIGLAGTKNVMVYDRDNPLEFFEKVLNATFTYIKENPFVAKMFVLMGQAQYNEAAPQAVKDLISQLDSIEMSVPLIEAGQKRGLIREGNPLSLAIAFWCSIQGIAEALALCPDIPCPEPGWIIDILRKKD